MVSQQSDAKRPGADPMAGPNFMLGRIKSYDRVPGSDGSLLLQDGTSWRVPLAVGDFDANSDLIVLARREGLIFISGDLRTFVVDRVAIPRRLSALSVGPLVDGRHRVSFAGPPSIYYVVQRRPWAEQALALLRRSVESRPPLDQPDLLVSVDVVTSEIMDVRPAP